MASRKRVSPPPPEVPGPRVRRLEPLEPLPSQLPSKKRRAVPSARALKAAATVGPRVRRIAVAETGPQVTSRKRLYAAKWMALYGAEYQDRHGDSRTWEYVARTNTTTAVVVVAQRLGDSGPEWILVRQFRPPVGQWVWEFPAGLVDPGEAPEVAALRELREETGFLGEVTAEGPAVFSSPGLTNESVRVVEVQITGRGAAAPEASEALEVHLVPVAQLRQRLLEGVASGDGVDAKLWMLAR